MSVAPIVVLKFGSSVLPDESGLPGVVGEIGRWIRRGYRVIAVVSALGDTTDRLIRRAKLLARFPDDAAKAALVAVGESETAGVLGLALGEAGLAANVLDPGDIGLRTTGPLLDAQPESLDVQAVRRALADRPILIIPGFIGRDELGRTSLLGRGGSDFSALYFAQKLHAQRCVLFKDVDGLYDRDPAQHPGVARRYRTIRWDDVLELSEGIVQHKGVRFAKDHGFSFTVARLGNEGGSTIGPGPTLLEGDSREDVA